MEEKKNKGQGVLIIVLFMIVIGMGLYICYDKFYTKNISNNTNSNDVETKTTEKTVTNISVDSDIVKTAMELYEKIYVSSDIIYKNDSYDISAISKADLISTAVSNVDGDYIYWCGQKSKNGMVSIEMLNDVLDKYILNKKIYLNDIKEELKIYDSFNSFGIEIKGDKIKIDGICGAIFEPEDFIEKKIVKAETDSDYLYVYEKAAFARYTDETDLANDKLIVDYYKDYARTIVVQKNMKSFQTVGPDETKPIEELPNWDLYNTYKYTFKKVNDVYYFQNIKLSN